jgi:hypothetical protein
VGSTLYADRGPPFGLRELYADRWKVTSAFVQRCGAQSSSARTSTPVTRILRVGTRAFADALVCRTEQTVGAIRRYAG